MLRASEAVLYRICILSVDHSERTGVEVGPLLTHEGKAARNLFLLRTVETVLTSK